MDSHRHEAKEGAGEQKFNVPLDAGVDMHIPEELQRGVVLTKVSEKHKDKKKQVVFRVDPDEGTIKWEREGKMGGCVQIESIKELRSSPEHLSLRIIYILSASYKSLHLLFPTLDLFNTFTTAVNKLHNIRQGLAPSSAGSNTLADLELRDAVWERQYWKGADEEGDQKLDFDDVQRLCRRLNVRLTSEQLKGLIQEAAPNQTTLDFPAFQRFVRKLKARPELEKVYQHLSKESVDPEVVARNEMDWVAFEKFMRGVQKSTMSDEELKDLFESYATVPEHSSSSPPPESEPKSITLKSFSYLLSSPALGVFKKETHDMTMPLSAYYISSSHNTYLVGHQLVGVSTTEGYIRALLCSCRSVELDIYDSPTGPMVYHGKTLTSPVSLKDICVAINKYGFVTSPYPIILSAEVHLSVKGQEEMVDVLEECFGERLVKVRVGNESGGDMEGVEVIEGGGAVRVERLPSPEELRGKVLVKAKNLFEVAKLASINAALVKEKAKLEDSSSSSSSDEDEPRGVEGGKGGLKDSLKSRWRKLRGKSPTPSPTPSPSTPPATGVVASTGARASTPSGESENGNGKIKMSLRLASLLVYTVGIKCHGLGPDIPYQPQHMFSLSESKAQRLFKANMHDLIRHTQGHLVRVYPKGTRVSSSNYEPHRFWASGAQVVALNWQTFDLGYMINQAMFLRNNRAGYLLKPQALREPDSELLNKKTSHFFRVSIISAQQLPRLRDDTGQEIVEKSIVDPFVEVSLHIPDWTHSPFLPSAQTTSSSDVKYSPPKDASATQPTEARTVSVKTRVIKNNGFNPVWEEEFMVPFDCVGGMRELIFVEFKVLQEGKDDDDDVPIGSYIAPLGSLESGYRYLPLHDNQMSPYLFSTLFVKIDVRDTE